MTIKHMRVNEIDLLRFFAALAVVFFHYTFRGYAADNMSIVPYPLFAPFSKYGYLGVELFFMISGFVILMTAANGSLKSFIVSRVVRLYPAFWACCTLTFLVIVGIGGIRFTASMSQYLINMTMLNGFVGVPSIDGAYWSLFVEIKFYVLVGLVLVFRKIEKIQILLSLWLAISFVIALLPLSHLRNIVSNVLVADYSAYFIAGAAYYLIWSQGVSFGRVLLVLFSLSLAIFQSVSALTAFQLHYHTEMSSYMVTAIVITFFFLMLLISLRCTGSFGHRRWVLAGALTYPLYLIHQNIGFILFNFAYPAVNPYVLLGATILLVLCIAYLVHTFIEKKLSMPLKKYLEGSLGSIHRITYQMKESFLRKPFS